MGKIFTAQWARVIFAWMIIVPFVYGMILAGFSMTSTAKTKEVNMPASAQTAIKEPALEISNFASGLQTVHPNGNPAGQLETERSAEAKPKPVLIPKNQEPESKTDNLPAASKPADGKKPETSAPKEQPAPIKATAPGAPRPVYLTFDDGPHKTSGKLLNLLDKYQAKATFFMLDPNMNQFPAEVKRMAKSGHSLGLHGVTHSKELFYKSSGSVISEMNQAKATVKKLTGMDTVLIRTPFGSSPHMSPGYKKAVVENGFKMWDWSVDSRDWQYRNKRYVDSVIEQVEKQKRGAGPIVILLHEREETLEHLPLLLDYLASQNFSFAPLTDLMEPIQLK